MSDLNTLLNNVPLSAGISLPPATAEPVDFVLKLIKLTSTGEIYWEKTRENNLSLLRLSDYEAKVEDIRLVLSLAQGRIASVPTQASSASLRVIAEDGSAITVADVSPLSGLAVAVQTEVERGKRTAEQPQQAAIG